MEFLYHYLWQHRLFEEKELCTTDGRLVTLLQVGVRNQDEGPDFRGAQLRIGEELWVGDVEIHLRSSDWYAHGHNHNPTYNTTILHIVGEADREVRTAQGALLPQLVITPPASVRQRYEALLRETDTPACGTAWQLMDSLSWHAFLDRLAVERMEEKMQRILTYLRRTEGDWERTFFIALARSFGFGINGDAFEAWAWALRPSDLAKHRDDPALIEAYFLGMAGLLDKDRGCGERSDEDYRRLCRDFAFLRQKFSLTPLSPTVWKFLRLRPHNFPSVRIAQLVDIYCSQRLSLSKLLAVPSLPALHALLAAAPLSYSQPQSTWEQQPATPHKKPPSLHDSSIDRLVINTVAPFLFTYGRTHQREDLCERALSLWAATEAENDRIVRCWKAFGCQPEQAAHTQALHHLTAAYCTPKRCTLCPIGRRWLVQEGSSEQR